MRASHIKPWRDSDNAERLDKYNGLLLIPNLDVAFDKGLISFKDDGMIMISPHLSPQEIDLLGIKKDMKIKKEKLTHNHKKYLKYHRNKIFKN